MRNTKFFKLFQTFSAWELRHLRQFVESPFFNKRQDVLQLLDFMIKESKKEKPKYDKQKAFKLLFPKIKYSETKMNTTVSYLFKLTEQFLSMRHFQQDTSAQKWYLAQAYKEQKQEKNYHSTLDSYALFLEKQPFRDSEFWWKKYQLEFEQFNLLIKGNRSKEANLPSLTHAFDVHFVANKLRLACIIQSRKRLFKQEQQNLLIDEINTFLEQNSSWLEIPAIAMHYYCYKTMTDKENENYFEQFLYWLTQRRSEFSIKETGSLYLAAINYCIQKANKGVEKYWQKSLELYQVVLEEGWLMQQKYLSKFTFSNIVANGLRVKAMDWTADFIEKYQKYLNPNERANICYFNLARWHIQKEEYDAALEQLRFYQFDDNYHYLIAKTMLVKIYYKQEAIEALLATLDAMNSFLNRKEVLNVAYRLHFKNVIGFMRKLLKIGSMSSIERKNLRKEMEECVHFFDKGWFLEQVF